MRDPCSGIALTLLRWDLPGLQGPEPPKSRENRYLHPGSPSRAGAAQPARRAPALWQKRQYLQCSAGLGKPLATPRSPQQLTMGCLSNPRGLEFGGKKQPCEQQKLSLAHSRTLFFIFCCSAASRSFVASLSKDESISVFSCSLEGQDAEVKSQRPCPT